MEILNSNVPQSFSTLNSLFHHTQSFTFSISLSSKDTESHAPPPSPVGDSFSQTEQNLLLNGLRESFSFQELPPERVEVLKRVRAALAPSHPAWIPTAFAYGSTTIRKFWMRPSRRTSSNPSWQAPLQTRLFGSCCPILLLPGRSSPVSCRTVSRFSCTRNP
jgi:hypothetical protein